MAAIKTDNEVDQYHVLTLMCYQEPKEKQRLVTL